MIVSRAADKLKNIKSIIKRREAFTKLQTWLRRFVLKWHGNSLFTTTDRNNRRFIKKQIDELGMRWRNGVWCTQLLEW